MMHEAQIQKGFFELRSVTLYTVYCTRNVTHSTDNFGSHEIIIIVKPGKSSRIPPFFLFGKPGKISQIV
jgi:hypothetical protein